jgi:NAD(P)-dependent dehydrogenase (short-subunit alcohol dehydrogenase family)
LRLAGEGADVAIAGLDRDSLNAAVAEIEDLGRRALAVVADIRNEQQVEAMAAATGSALGPIEILVNNAAIIGPTAGVAQIRRADWDDVLAVNLTGAFLCCRAVLPGMLARRSGKIINIASMAGKMAYPLRSPYAVSKWGLIGLTLTLAQEVGSHGIQVNAVCPGPVEGERMRRIIQTRAEELGLEPATVERDYLTRSALQRMVTADDVAAMVAFLASAEADNITGQALDVSAGYGL